MIRIITNWRYHALMLVSFLAIVGLFSEPSSKGAQWLVEFAISKVIGIVALYAFYRLAKRWFANGSIPELKNLVKED